MQQKYLFVAVIALALVGLSYFLIAKRPTSETAKQAENVQQTDMIIQETESINTDDTSGPSAPPSSAVAKTSNVTTDASESSVKDGKYTAVGEYKAPSGMEKVGVTITIKDGIIADADVEIMAVNDTSKRMQGLFKGGYKEKVIGKALTDVQLDAVGGSSLTPKGFQDAINKILKEASV